MSMAQPTVTGSIATSTASNRSQSKPSFAVNTVSGGIAGLVSTVATYPLDLIKTRFQVTDGRRRWAFGAYRSTVHALRSIYSSHGITGLYGGLGPSLIGAGVAWGSFFGLYGLTKSKLTAFRDGRDPSKRGSALSAPYHLLAGANAGAVTSIITNPIWVIKTRMQTQSSTAAHAPFYRGTWHALQSIIATEGVRGLYRGLVPALFNTSHGAVQFMAYEELRRIAIDRFCDPATASAAGLGLGSAANSNRPKCLTDIHFLMIGAAAKMIASSVSYPVQLLRARMQTVPFTTAGAGGLNHPLPIAYTGMVQALATTVRNEGLLGLYKGWAPTIIRVTPQAMINFWVFERCSAALRIHWT